jgi:RNase P/RNase MRP subunit p30
MFGPPLEEGGGEAVIVVGGRDGDGLQAAVEDVVIDAVIVDELIQQTAQGALSNR